MTIEELMNKPCLGNVYLAGPYTDPDPVGRIRRFRRLTYVAARLTQAGHVVFSPITHFHLMTRRVVLSDEPEFWNLLNKAFLKWADTLVVDRFFDAWSASRGVAFETATASAMKIPIYYVEGGEEG